MATSNNVMQSLFGVTNPAQAQQEYMGNYMVSPAQLGQQGLLQQLVSLGGNAGAMIGTGAGRLFGGMTPQEAEQKQVQGLFGGASLTDADQLSQAAERFAQAGDVPRAQALMGQAQELRTAQATAMKQQQAMQKEELLRETLSSLPPDASDKDVEVAVRQFGNPDQIFKAMERRQTADANREAKAALEAEKAERAEVARQERMQFQQNMAMLAASQRAATNDLQRQQIQQKIDAAVEKQREAADKKQMALDMSVRHANKVITDVDEARSLVSSFTTGIPGKAASIVPGTDAFNLGQRVLTLKANLGFDRLQQMRDASPTGGALGQVAVQELEALQASVGSLEVGQSKSELLKNLNKVDKHYRAWLAAVQGARGEAAQTTPTAAPAGGGWSVKPKTN